MSRVVAGSLVCLLLQGRYPQPHMQGRQGRELCLYRRATGKASVSEADALLKP